MPEPQVYISTDYASRPEKPTTHRPHSTVRRHVPKLGNPTPLGLSAFALSTMLVSFYNYRTFSVTVPNVIVGVSLFTGGIVQFAAGMWEFKVGNTFGGTGFSAFGGFWGSLGALYIPGFGIQDAFRENYQAIYGANSVWNPNTDPVYNNALGTYCLAWFIFTSIFTAACMRTNIGVLGAFIFLSLTFMALTIAHFALSDLFLKASGILGLITSVFVWYCTAATLLTPDLSPISLPLGDLSRKDLVDRKSVV